MNIFYIWLLCSLIPIGLGTYAWNARKPINFWANINKRADVSDVKSYNQAVAKLWWLFGMVFIFLGLPLLSEKNSPLIMLTVLGTMFNSIFMMIMLRRIEIKYKKDQDESKF